MGLERRLGATMNAAAWVSRRFVAMGVVVLAVLFEWVLWWITHLANGACAYSTTVGACDPGETLGPQVAPTLPRNRHEAVFWIVNGLLVGAVVGVLMALRMVRRARGRIASAAVTG
jgi:hypothetical protein